MSDRASISSPCACSGDMYSGVPGRDLTEDQRGAVERQSAASLEHVFERAAFDVFHHDECETLGLAIVVDGHNVRMIELGDGARFALEALAELGILGEVRRENFDSDVALQAGLVGFVDARHAAFAQKLKDFVLAECAADQIVHDVASSFRSWDLPKSDATQ